MAQEGGRPAKPPGPGGRPAKPPSPARAPAPIDLHCHILPGLDDGPQSMDESVAFAKRIHAVGTRTVAATPHVREDYPFPLEALPAKLAELRDQLSQADIGLELARGGEVALSRVPDLTDEELSGLCLGAGPYLLVESPYTRVGDVLERCVFDLEVRGFRPLLAHPERSPTFQADPDRLTEMVGHGVLCSVTGSSMTGRFGKTVQRFTSDLFGAGLVHNIASDAHGDLQRSPDLLECVQQAGAELAPVADAAAWFTQEVPQAILSGSELPPRPAGLDDIATRRSWVPGRRRRRAGRWARPRA